MELPHSLNRSFDICLLLLRNEPSCSQATLTEVDRHDNAYWYHKLTLQELQDLVPQFNWLQYLSSFLTIKIDSNESLVSYSTPYFIEMGKILQKTSRR